MTTLPLTRSIGRSPLRLGFLLIPLALAGLALLPQARAVCQDACLTNFNTVQGDDALVSLTTGVSNTAFGSQALRNLSSSIGSTAVGVDALYSDTTGYVNTAVGFFSLFDNTTGFSNTAVGAGALQQNGTGFQNTATGGSALQDNFGSNNTATGYDALFFNTSGNNNTAMGESAMGGNVDIPMTGSNNTATGATALQNNTTGFNNAADGYQALTFNTTGNYNTASGQGALNFNSTGSNNAALGQNALLKNTTGSANIAIGSNAGFALTTGSNNIDIGNRGVAGESNTIRVGRQGTQTATFIAGVSGATVAGGVGVIVDASGHLGTVVSSARFKDAIKPMDKASEAILSLQPVTFHYKHDLDPNGIPQFGLVAEQVEKVDPDLVARDEKGKPYTVRYEAVNAMLLNEFLKEHRTVQELKSTVAKQEATAAQQQKEIHALTETLKAQAVQIQKVSEQQLRTQAPAPRVVANN